jgi:hypothetical protein
MRIAYFVHLNMGQESGVYRKVQEQAQLWRSLGHTCRVFVLTRAADVSEGLAGQVANGNVEIYTYLTGLSLSALTGRLRAFRLGVSAVLDWHPDLVYTRQDLYYPPVGRMAKSLPLVLEVNSRDSIELWDESKLKWLYHVLTRRRILRAARGFVFVTRELADTRPFARYRKKHTVVANGINLSEIAQREPSGLPDIRIVFVGQRGYPWHGVDKLMTIATSLPDWSVDVVGWRRADLGASVPGNVTFHGPLRRAACKGILERADCAIGTLALHRKGMQEACPLKTREYLAYGLPVVIGYKDTDFPRGEDFLLQLPNREDNVRQELPAIREFVLRWKGKRVPRDAIAHIDGVTKELARLEFFSSLHEPFSERND